MAEDFERLFAQVDDIAELDDGYALRFPNEGELITRATELIIAERKCCPLFSFSLVFEPK